MRRNRFVSKGLIPDFLHNLCQRGLPTAKLNKVGSPTQFTILRPKRSHFKVTISITVMLMSFSVLKFPEFFTASLWRIVKSPECGCAKPSVVYKKDFSGKFIVSLVVNIDLSLISKTVTFVFTSLVFKNSNIKFRSKVSKNLGGTV